MNLTIDRSSSIECGEVIWWPVGSAFSLAPSDAVALLDDSERARAARFIRAGDRDRFVNAHAGLRVLLGKRLALAPASLTFDADRHGKPRVSGRGRGDLRFNLSHSGDYAVVVIASGREVGVDVERHRSVDVLELARAHFSQSECAALQHVDDALRTEAFFRLWTCKESFAKAHGLGLQLPMTAFDVSLDGGGQNLLLRCREDLGSNRAWTIRTLEAPAGYSAAVTFGGRDDHGPT